MGSKIQNEDVKSEADLLAKSGTKDQLIHDTKIYVTAEGLNKRLDEAITDGDIGGGGVGGINHILDQSEDATLWTNDVNFTITDNTTNPLRGDQDLLIEKAGVDASGEVVSVPFTIDDADKGKKLPLSFDYKNSGTYQDGDYEIEIYDVSSAIVVSNTNPSIISQDNFTASHVTYWDANFASTSYELRVRCITADTNTSSMQVDNLQTGPVNCKAGGSFISDWIDFTPTGTWSGPITYTGKYRRVGSQAEIQYSLVGSGAPTGSFLYFDMPTGLTVDSSSVVFSGNGSTYVTGSGEVLNAGLTTYPVSSRLELNSNQFRPLIEDTGAAYTRFTNVTPTIPFSFNTGDSVQITASVPIQGWGTGIKPAEVISGRTFVAEGVGNAETVITAAVTNIDFTVTRDEGGAFSGTEYTAQETGDYNVDGMVFFQGAPQFRAVDTYRDTGSGYAEYKRVGSTLTDGAFHFSGNVFLNKGDKLAFRMAGVGGTLSNSIPSVHWVKISKENSLNAQLLPDDTSSNINAVIISDWEDFTPTGTWTGPVTYTGRYRRVGGQAEIQYKVLTTGAPTGSTLLFDMPAGLSVDETKIVTSDLVNYTTGVGEVKDTGSSVYNVVGRYQNAVNQVAPVLHDTALTTTRASAVNPTSPVTFANGDAVILTVTLPIQGWETGIKPTEVVEGRLHFVEASGNDANTITAGTEDVPFKTISIDESASWSNAGNTGNNTADAFTAPESGYYEVSGYINHATNAQIAAVAYIDGSVTVPQVNLGLGDSTDFPINGTLYLDKGQVLTIRLSVTTVLSPTGHRITISKLNNLSAQIQPTETVSANYVTDAGQLMINNALTTVVYEDKSYDTHNSYNSSTGVYTIPITGKYLVNAGMRYTNLNVGNNSSIHADIFVNGALARRAYPIAVELPGLNPQVTITAVLELTAGETLEIQGFQNNGANRNLVVDSRDNYFSITKIGN